jgi:hypothetical protein
VYDTVIRLAVDLDVQVMGVVQGFGHGLRHFGSEFRGQRAAAHPLMQVAAVDEFHGHEEEAVQVAGLIYAHNVGIDGGQARLQFGAAAFGFDGVAGVGVGAVLDQLERHGLGGFAVESQVHIGHAAAPQLLADLELSEPAPGGGNHILTPDGRSPGK